MQVQGAAIQSSMDVGNGSDHAQPLPAVPFCASTASTTAYSVRAASTCVLRALPATRDLVRRTAVWKRGSRGTARGAPGALRRWPTPTVGLLGVYGTSIRTHYWMLSADFNMCLLSACMGDCTRLVAQLMVLWVKKSCSNVISGAGGRSAMHLTAIGAHSSDPDRWPPGSTLCPGHNRLVASHEYGEFYDVRGKYMPPAQQPRTMVYLTL